MHCIHLWLEGAQLHGPSKNISMLAETDNTMVLSVSDVGLSNRANLQRDALPFVELHVDVVFILNIKCVLNLKKRLCCHA